MESIVILEKMITILEKNSDAIAQMDLQELATYLNEDFSFYKDIYAPNQYAVLSDLLLKKTKDLVILSREFDVKQTLLMLSSLKDFFTVLPHYENTIKKVHQAHFDHAARLHFKNHSTVVIGDSHVNFFSGNENLTFLPIGEDFNVCPQVNGENYTVIHCGPCLAYTSDSDSSTYQFKKKVLYLLENLLLPGDSILLSLGEIDMRVHVIKEAQKQNRPYTDIVDDILSHYEHTILWLKSLGYHISIWGPIASQTDRCPLDSHFPRFGSEVERNLATHDFTQKLSAFCQKEQIPFHSIFHKMVDEHWHTREEYLSCDRCHLGQKAKELLL